jgi:hypothetical protein
MHRTVIEVMTGEREQYRRAEAEQRHRLAGAKGGARPRRRQAALLWRMLTAQVRKP